MKYIFKNIVLIWIGPYQPRVLVVGLISPPPLPPLPLVSEGPCEGSKVAKITTYHEGLAWNKWKPNESGWWETAEQKVRMPRANDSINMIMKN